MFKQKMKPGFKLIRFFLAYYLFDQTEALIFKIMSVKGRNKGKVNMYSRKILAYINECR